MIPLPPCCFLVSFGRQAASSSGAVRGGILNKENKVDNELNVVMVPIKDLIAAEYNPRKMTENQRKALTDRIKRFGLIDPCIVNCHEDRKNIVIGGHQRLVIAAELEIAEAPCVMVELDRERERELNIRLNQNTGDWDWEALGKYFESEELVDWGFDQKELEAELLAADPGNMPDDLADVDLQGDTAGTNDWVVVRFEQEADYEHFCDRLEMKPGARTVDYADLKKIMVKDGAP